MLFIALNRRKYLFRDILVQDKQIAALVGEVGGNLACRIDEGCAANRGDVGHLSELIGEVRACKDVVL